MMMLVGEPEKLEDEDDMADDTPARPSHVRAQMARTTARNIGVEGWIPVRTAKEAPADLDLRLAFVLLHADGRASVGDIATAVQRPPLDVLGSFVELASLGLVELGGSP